MSALIVCIVCVCVGRITQTVAANFDEILPVDILLEEPTDF